MVDREYVETYPVNWRELNQQDVNRIYSGRSKDAIKRLSLYIHVPFCPIICPFCKFNKTLYDKRLYEQFLSALRLEVLSFRNHPDAMGREVDAIYIGGGTGSLLRPDDTHAILDTIGEVFKISANPEITVECYPDTIDGEKLAKYRDVGVNRVSIGTQSFNDRFLRSISRTHTGAGNRQIMQAAKDLGFKVGMDLMYRLPGQEIQDIMDDISVINGLRPDSVSTYSLEVEGTPMNTKLQLMANDEEDKQMFYAIGDKMEEIGFHRFAQPDFALPGGECRYVVNAWKAPQSLLLAFGPGAHTHYFGGHIWANVYPVQEYITRLTSGRSPIVVGEQVPEDELMAKFMVLGVRCSVLSKSLFRQLFNREIADVFPAAIASLVEKGWIVDEGTEYVVTREGVYYVDNISRSFHTEKCANFGQPWTKNLYDFVPESSATLPSRSF